MVSELKYDACGQMTKSGTLCKWSVGKCPVESHNKRRNLTDAEIAERIRDFYMTKTQNPDVDWDNAPRKRLPEAGDPRRGIQRMRARTHKGYWVSPKARRAKGRMK